MNVFGKNERSWRKARKRGVSPIIATILLVAITVVLAAVLYVLISGLTGGGVGTKPIGSAFNAGNPVAGTCTAAGVTANTCAVAGDAIYTLTVESSTVSFGSVLFEVKTSGGGIYSNTLAGNFAVLTIAGVAAAWSPIAAGAGLAMPVTFTHYSATAGLCGGSVACSTSSSLTSLFTVVIDTGSATATTGQGLTFVALGTGSYSGTTAALALP